jgi:DNA polymerase
MATTHDVLDALHLLPQWQRRTYAGLGAAPAVAARDEAQPLRAESAPESAPRFAPSVAPPLLAEPAPAFVARESLAPLTIPAREPARDEVAPVDADLRRARIAVLDWSAFDADVDACTACGLCRTRKRSVPGVGDRSAQWLFVGEAPGAEEDAKGEPFVGQAGRLLDNMLTAIGLARGDRTYIANVLKCRPPNNRTPEPREVEACMPYLDRQIALIAPKLVVALGRSAANGLLGVDQSIASLRGRVHRFRGLPLIVTYHPAYLLRTLPDKAKAWEDLLFARRTMAQIETGS